MYKIVVTSFVDPMKQVVRTRKAYCLRVEDVIRRAHRLHLNDELPRSEVIYALSIFGWELIQESRFEEVG